MSAGAYTNGEVYSQVNGDAAQAVEVQNGEITTEAGVPVSFGQRRQHASGVFAGKVMRFGLEIAQQPLLGRKFGEKDRRPLAHSPICRLHIKQCTSNGSGEWAEEIVDVQHVETTAFVCSVDLFTPAVTTATGAQQRTKCTHVSPAPKSRSVDGRAEKRAKSHALRNLFGNLNVTAIRIAAPEGGMGMWFIFSDVCVRHEGSYSLRFRVFDLSALTAPLNQDSESDSHSIDPPIAESFSDAFRVYSPRTFPGLPKTQTALSEHFSRQGFKLNVRKGASKDDADELDHDRHRPKPVPLQRDGHAVSHGQSSSSTVTSTATGLTSDSSVKLLSASSISSLGIGR